MFYERENEKQICLPSINFPNYREYTLVGLWCLTSLSTIFQLYRGNKQLEISNYALPVFFPHDNDSYITVTLEPYCYDKTPADHNTYLCTLYLVQLDMND